MSIENRVPIKLTSSQLYAVHAIDCIINSVTNGHSRGPHQLNIRFTRLHGTEADKTASKLEVRAHAWSDVGNESNIDFLIDFEIRTDDKGRWVMGPDTIHIGMVGTRTIALERLDDEWSLKTLLECDTAELAKWRNEHGLSIPEQSGARRVKRFA